MKSCPEIDKASTAPTVKALSDESPTIKKGINMSDSTEVAAVLAITVPFHGADLFVIEHDGQPYTPMKPIITGMGLTWHGQHAKIKSNSVRWGILELRIPSAGGLQDMLCIPLRKLPGWLSNIEAGKVKDPQARQAVIRYQDECDEVLWQYWNDGVAVNPRPLYSVNPGDVLTKEEADTLRQLIESTAKKLAGDSKTQGKFILQAWSKLKSHFKVGYRGIPRHELTEAISIVNRHTVEWEVVDDEPRAKAVSVDPARIKMAQSKASLVASKVHDHVFNELLGSDRWEPGRWLLSVKHSGDSSEPTVRAVPDDAVVASIKKLAGWISTSDFPVRDSDVAELAAACSQRLARHLAQ